MPIYEYECVTNKHRFEVIQKFDDPRVAHCTICGEPVQRLLSAPAIQFKGTGWYITDYARKGDSSSKSDKSSGEKASTEESKTTETKTEAGPTPTSTSSDKKDS